MCRYLIFCSAAAAPVDVVVRLLVYRFVFDSLLFSVSSIPFFLWPHTLAWVLIFIFNASPICVACPLTHFIHFILIRQTVRWNGFTETLLFCVSNVCCMEIWCGMAVFVAAFHLIYFIHNAFNILLIWYKTFKCTSGEFSRWAKNTWNEARWTEWSEREKNGKSSMEKRPQCEHKKNW